MNHDSWWKVLGLVGLHFWNVSSIWFQIDDYRQSISSYPRFWSGLVIVCALLGSVGLLVSLNKRLRKRIPNAPVYSLSVTLLGIVLLIGAHFLAKDKVAPEAQVVLEQIEQRLITLENAVGRKLAEREASKASEKSPQGVEEATNRSPEVAKAAADVIVGLRKAQSVASRLSRENASNFASALEGFSYRVEALFTKLGAPRSDNGPRNFESSSSFPSTHDVTDPSIEANSSTVEAPFIFPLPGQVDSGPAPLFVAQIREDGKYVLSAPIGQFVVFMMPPPELPGTEMFFRPASTTFTGSRVPRPSLVMNLEAKKNGANGIFSVNTNGGAAGEEWPFIVTWCLSSRFVVGCESPQWQEISTVVLILVPRE